jgi:hypothetical protein
MSALEKLDGLMAGLKTIEHDRWDTAALAVLELAKGGRSELDRPADPAEFAAMKAQVSQMAEQLKVMGEAMTALLNAPAVAPAVSEPAPQPAAPQLTAQTGTDAPAA